MLSIDSRGRSVLHLAILVKNETISRKLVARFPVDVNLKEGKGNSPLHLACILGMKNLVFDLLMAHAETRLQGMYGRTALQFAVEVGNLKITRLLLEFRAPTEVSTEGLLHEAVRYGHEDIVKLLLSYGASIAAAGFRSSTALHEAVERDNPKLVRLLIISGAHLEARDMGGQTPLSRAAELGNMAAVNCLTEFPVDLNSLDFADMTPLSYASIGGDEAIVDRLLSLGADVDRRNKMGSTAIAFAKMNRHFSVIQKLLDANTDIHIRARDGFTPFVIVRVRGTHYLAMGSKEMIPLRQGQCGIRKHPVPSPPNKHVSGLMRSIVQSHRQSFLVTRPIVGEGSVKTLIRYH